MTTAQETPLPGVFEACLNGSSFLAPCGATGTELHLRTADACDGRWRVNQDCTGGTAEWLSAPLNKGLNLFAMQNVLYGAVWQFNVLTWDNQASPTMSPRGAVNLEPIFRPGGTVADLPWKVCAKVSGRTVTLKAWRGDEAEPAWGDASHGGSVTLPAGWDYAGKAGWYLGHIPPGGYGAMTGLRTAALSG